MASAVFLAGGEGTRLFPLTKEIPKPLLHVRGKAMIQYQLEALISSGVSRFLICVLKKQEHTYQPFVNSWRRRYGVWIELVIEDEPLGTGGALLNAVRQNAESLGEVVFVANADIICNFPFAEMLWAFSCLQERFDTLERVFARAGGAAGCPGRPDQLVEGSAAEAEVSGAASEAPALAQPGCLIMTTFTDTPSLFGVVETSPLDFSSSPAASPDEALAGVLGDSESSRALRKRTQLPVQGLTLASSPRDFQLTDSSLSTSMPASGMAGAAVAGAVGPEATSAVSAIPAASAVSAVSAAPAVAAADTADVYASAVDSSASNAAEAVCGGAVVAPGAPLASQAAAGVATATAAVAPSPASLASPTASPGRRSPPSPPSLSKLARIVSYIEKPPAYATRRARVNGGMYLFTRDCLFACLEHFCPGALTELDLLRGADPSIARLTLAPLARKRSIPLLPLGLWTVVRDRPGMTPARPSTPQSPGSAPAAYRKIAGGSRFPGAAPPSEPLWAKTARNSWEAPDLGRTGAAANAVSAATPAWPSPSTDTPSVGGDSPASLRAGARALRAEAIRPQPMGGGAYLLCCEEPLLRRRSVSGRKISLERDIFPWLLSSSRGWTASKTPEGRASPSVPGYLLYSLDYDSFWSDLGTIDGMIRGMQLLIGAGEGQSDISPHSFLGVGAHIHNSIIHEGVFIGENAVIEHSIIGQGARIPPSLRVTNTIVAPYSDLSSARRQLWEYEK